MNLDTRKQDTGPMALLAKSAWIVCAVAAALAGGGCFGPDSDRDQDGAPAETDCNDQDARVFPGNDEVAYNGLDDDCDPETLDDDLDRDGYPVASDCDDARDDIHPDAVEICDAADNDCDLLTDDDDPDITGQPVWFEDGDGDGHGSPSTSRAGCAQPPGYVEGMLDCDDSNAAVLPGAPEQCDAVDDDCSGSLLPCASTVTFDDPGDLDLLVPEGSTECAAAITAEGLRIECPDDADVVYWLDFAIEDAQSIRILTQVYTDNWADDGPRIGINVGSGIGPWGPNPGYSFHLGDPVDNVQGTLCTNGDACPSITRDNQTILALQDVGTSPDQSYALDVTLDDAGEAFVLSFAGSSYTLTASDRTVRTGRVGLRCGEANYTFENLSIAIE